MWKNLQDFYNHDILQLNNENWEQGWEQVSREEKCQIWNHMITDSSSSRGPTISEPLSCVIAVLSLLLAWQMMADMSDNCVSMCVCVCVCV